MFVTTSFRTVTEVEKKINNGDDLTAIVDSSKVGEPLNLVVLRGDRYMHGCMVARGAQLVLTQ